MFLDHFSTTNRKKEKKVQSLASHQIKVEGFDQLRRIGSPKCRHSTKITIRLRDSLQGMAMIQIYHPTTGTQVILWSRIFSIRTEGMLFGNLNANQYRI